MLRSRFTEMFGIDHPVMSAPMALHSGGSLAGAVSAAGGLGSFGGIHPARGPDWLRAELTTLRAATDRPYAVGFITPFLPFTEQFFEVTVAERPAAVVFSFSDPRPWIERARDVGIATICQVQTVDDAVTAVDAGADVLVAQGTEAGGHTGTMGVLPLLCSVLANHPDLPVLAAGGIADGRALAAVLAAGADGALVGTAFLATPEAVEVHDVHKRLIVESDGGDTVFTRVYDIVSGLPWPSAIGERVRRNRFTDEWSEREAELRARREELAPPPDAVPFQDAPDPDSDSVIFGQAAGFVDAVRPAAEVLGSICADAEAILRTRPPSLLG